MILVIVICSLETPSCSKASQRQVTLTFSDSPGHRDGDPIWIAVLLSGFFERYSAFREPHRGPHSDNPVYQDLALQLAVLRTTRCLTRRGHCARARRASP